MAKKLHIDDLTPGDVAVVGYRNATFTAQFRGWVIEDGMPRAKFKDMEGFEWDAYLFEGKFCVGSSADPLKVISKQESQS